MNRVSFVHDAEHSYNYVKSLFRDVCVHAGTDLSRRLLTMSDLEIAQLDIRPADYEDCETFKVDYSLVKFLSKWKGLKTGVDTKEVAALAFMKQELKNVEINQRLRKAAGPMFIDSIIHRAQRIVANVLGEFSLGKLDGLEDWGPGATTDFSRRKAQLDSKISNFPIPVSYEARGILERAIKKDLHWAYCLLGTFPDGDFSILPSCFSIVNHADIVTVPKNAKTDRTIAIEPRGNMFLQKAAGRYIRRRLRRYGVDLDDQTRNQTLASVCKDRRLATIDLSMASDSVTIELVWLLLPFDWADYLDRLRSKRCFFEGNDIRLEKFSSMGNGFTFELESLIFYALVKASLEDESSTMAIYGDDIICPQTDAPIVISTLAYCGFVVNDDKSFVEGNFFESCGRHYFNGIDVTPCYQKELVNSDFEAIRLLNRVARLLLRSFVVDDRMVGPWRDPWFFRLRRLLKTHGLPFIPLGTEGDDGFLVNHSLCPTVKWNRNYGGKFPVIRQRPVFIPADDRALLAITLRRGARAEALTRSTEESVEWRADPLGHMDDQSIGFGGELPSRSAKGLVVMNTTRWIEPSWEFALD